VGLSHTPLFQELTVISQFRKTTMRTSAGGRKLPKWNRDEWISKDETADNCFKCPECGKIHWLIANPSPNTVGGTKPMRLHQDLCWD